MSHWTRIARVPQRARPLFLFVVFLAFCPSKKADQGLGSEEEGPSTWQLKENSDLQTVRAETTTELILKRAGPIIFGTSVP